MKNSSDKEKILKLLRASLLEGNQQVSLAEYKDENIYVGDDDPVMFFAEKVSEDGGKFVYCASEQELSAKLQKLIEYRQWNNVHSFSKNLWAYLDGKGIKTSMGDTDTEVGISLCQGIVSKTGSIILTSTQGIGSNMIHFPPILIIIATTSQIFPSYRQVLGHLPETPPKWVVSIRSGKLVSEEIKELYLFVTEM